jgi:hypothetical protein
MLWQVMWTAVLTAALGGACTALILLEHALLVLVRAEHFVSDLIIVYLELQRWSYAACFCRIQQHVNQRTVCSCDKRRCSDTKPLRDNLTDNCCYDDLYGSILPAP